MSLEDDENSEESSSANEMSTFFLDSSNNELYGLSWSNDDFMSDTNEEDEKIYEDLCYVTFSSSLSSEVIIQFPF